MSAITGFAPFVDGGIIGTNIPVIDTNVSAVQPIQYEMLRRTSIIMPTPQLGLFGFPKDWAPTEIINEEIGRYRIVVAGKDITYFRGVQTTLDQYGSQEPFDDDAAQFTLPQVSWVDRPGYGDLWWLGEYNVNIEIRKPDGSFLARPFEGLVTSVEYAEDGSAMVVQCIGALFQADLTLHKPEFKRTERDVGKFVADVMNTTPTANFDQIVPPVTGILTTRRGAWGPRLTGVLQEVLADAWTDDGTNQWTLMKNYGRAPVIRLKDLTTKHWTVSYGAPGVKMRVRDDWSMRANTIFGEGVAPGGGAWRNTKYPGWRPNDVPAYGGGSASNVLSVGETIGDFQPFFDELDNRGYNIESTTTYSWRDVDEVKDIQRRAGIQVDGIVGPQTWNAAFGVGADNSAALNRVYYAPLAVWSNVEPYLYYSDGSRMGKNPAYQSEFLRIERYENFGEGVKKKDAVKSARREIIPASKREHNYVGTMTLDADPEEGSRWLMHAGQNVFVKGFRRYQGLGDDVYGAHNADPVQPYSGGVLMHISKVTVIPGGTVTLELSLLPRDLVTLAAIKQRDRTTQADIARRKALFRKSKTQNDSYVVFDSESGAGIIPKHAAFGGLWNVFRIPAGEVGSIVKTTYASSDSTSKYMVGIFSGPITANQIAGIVGQGSAPFGNNIWEDNQKALRTLGLLIAWGGQNQNMGYYPKYETDTGASLTGDFLDDGTWEYASQHPPWLWVAELALNSTYLKGRLLPGIED